jgi:hypothetical protein
MSFSIFSLALLLLLAAVQLRRSVGESVEFINS